MDLITAMNGLIGSINGVKQLVNSAIEARDQTLVDKALGEMRDRLNTALDTALDLKLKELELAEVQATIQRRVRELEEENSALKNRAIDFERYALTELSPGVHVYALRPAAESEEPAHYLCSRCRNEGKKSILQRDTSTYATSLTCPVCKTRHPTGEVESMKINVGVSR